MRKIFEFEHGVIDIEIPTEDQIVCIKRATSDYMRRVIKERTNNGNISKGRN